MRSAPPPKSGSPQDRPPPRRRARREPGDKNFGKNLRRDLKGLYHFYLDEHERTRLHEMGRFRRWFLMMVWLLKNLILSLTLTRRILLLAGLYFFFLGIQSTSGPWQVELAESIQEKIGFLLILVVLMLELKDKLLARDELAVGRTVQSALMPEEMPKVPGWSIWLSTRPANEVGGDLVDYLPVCHERLGVVLADVAGKGLGAALLMAKLQSTLRAVATDFDSLAGLGDRVNRILVRDGLPNRFATLVLVSVKAGSSTLQLINAGHMLPLVLKEDRLESIQQRSLPLGIQPHEKFEVSEVEFQPGDRLIIYSDGVTEACDEEGHFFGEQRLEALLPTLRDLSPEELGKRLVKEVESFVGEGDFGDDLSLVILQRDPPAPPPANS